MRRARRVAVLVVAAAALWLAPASPAAAARSAWCGSGESAVDRPDVVTGPQVHLVYAVPADGVDHFADVVGSLTDAFASADAWWRGQDPTRTPRIDVASFGGGCTDVDISVVRLAQPASSFVGAEAAFQRLVFDVDAASLGDPWKRYVVFYDGPSVQPGVCGTGAGDFETGPGYAVVWLAGCPIVPLDAIAAHELLHALGALPAGAPHACPGDLAHPCDDPRDVLYPYSSGLPLAQLLLDAGHDDYYAHGGSWFDLQDSLWLRHLNASPVSLALTIRGAGTVHPEEGGPTCTSSCTTQWDPGSSVTLDPQPGPGLRFVRWTGCGTGVDYACRLTLAASRAIGVVFGPIHVSVHTTVAGRGKVACAPACSARFAAGAALRLRAVAAPGWRFVRWSGDCTGTRPTCAPPTDFGVRARATFAQAKR